MRKEINVKTYQKPEIEMVDFSTEAITDQNTDIEYDNVEGDL